MNYRLNFVEKIRYICFRPVKFFELMDEDEKLSESMVFFILVLLMVSPLNFILARFVRTDSSGLILLGLSVDFVLSLLFTLTILPFYHLFVYTFGGREGIRKSLQVFLYSATPVVLVSWIPIVPLLVSFYSIYVSVIGLKIVQRMGTLKALMSYMIPLLLLVTFIVISTINRFYG